MAVIIIHKVKDGDIDCLPDVMETPLANAYAGDPAYPTTPTMQRLAQLYRIISDRENHYQFNTPPAFGDPKYSFLDGMLRGFILSMSAELVDTDSTITIKKNGRKLLVVDRPVRPQSYYDDIAENNKMLNSL